MASVIAPVPRLELGSFDTQTEAGPGPVLQRWEDNERRLIATGGRALDAWWVHWHGLATFWFAETGIVRANPVGDGLEGHVRDVFGRAIVPMVLLARGFEALHASGVMSGSDVVALCGVSGTGKSTVAAALASAGLVHYADDTIVFRVAGGTPLAFSIPFPVRVGAPAEAFPAGGGSERHPEAAAAPLTRIYQLARDATLNPFRPSFTPVPVEKRFPLLLSHAHPFDMGTADRRRTFFQNLLTLARTVDVWECRFAPDLAALPSLAAAIRAHLPQR